MENKTAMATAEKFVSGYPTEEELESAVDTFSSDINVWIAKFPIETDDNLVHLKTVLYDMFIAMYKCENKMARDAAYSETRLIARDVINNFLETIAPASKPASTLWMCLCLAFALHDKEIKEFLLHLNVLPPMVCNFHIKHEAGPILKKRFIDLIKMLQYKLGCAHFDTYTVMNVNKVIITDILADLMKILEPPQPTMTTTIH